MTDTNLIETIEGMVDEFLQPHPEYFRVHVKIKPINNIKIFLDGDQGIAIEKCVSLHRALYKFIEEKAFFPEGDYSLEVSSPGVEEPLRLHRQYIKNIGRNVEIILTDTTKKEGKLIEITNDTATIESSEGKGKKAITTQTVISFLDIKTTTVQIKF